MYGQSTTAQIKSVDRTVVDRTYNIKSLQSKQACTNEKRGRSIGFSPAWIVRNKSGFSLTGYYWVTLAGGLHPSMQSNVAVAENAAQSEM